MNLLKNCLCFIIFADVWCEGLGEVMKKKNQAGFESAVLLFLCFCFVACDDDSSVVRPEDDSSSSIEEKLSSSSLCLSSSVQSGKDSHSSSSSVIPASSETSESSSSVSSSSVILRSSSSETSVSSSSVEPLSSSELESSSSESSSSSVSVKSSSSSAVYSSSSSDDPYLGCRCTLLNAEPDLAKGERVEWHAEGCNFGSGEYTYEWTGAEVSYTKDYIASGNLPSYKASTSGVSFVASDSWGSAVRVRCKNAVAVNSNVLDENWGEMTDPRDGQTYLTVKIGEQIWMAQNLNYKAEDSYCFAGDTANCSFYGRLYTWSAAMDSVGRWTTNGAGCGMYVGKSCSPTYPVQGVCPEGWVLPTKEDWEKLLEKVGGEDSSGVNLRSAYYSWPGQYFAKDLYGFAALLGGYREYGGDFLAKNNIGYFWSSSEAKPYHAYFMSIRISDDDAYMGSNYKAAARSVRCLKL